MQAGLYLIEKNSNLSDQIKYYTWLVRLFTEIPVLCKLVTLKLMNQSKCALCKDLFLSTQKFIGEWVIILQPIYPYNIER